MTRITRFALRHKAFVVLFWLATAIAGFTILEVGANAATPVWVTLSMFGLNHLIEANSPEAREEAEEAEAAAAATT